ncbi:23S rRNA (uracil(1939)-C(5))-methyltransferase RlmD [Thermococcus argininiproducens]|uniref:23S rRNA (Uracil(1939)-C(5))-methyltransferase RlmD n=1 Tax=Thermococcus argininiproducens TaxID=2866384 RepID=A0A9E7M935_9EURY|nr:23S rRNA (uracil(1939)-C(5))-methyltransferase RlmD [Thermococcus argininiproducens]USG98986.1 23S rRNA (uracil(1939)-C(5))-methyltransferase RlmD [Thermococcus argininiproducens]
MRVEIKRLSPDGFGETEVGEKKILVPFTVPGDIVDIRKWHREKRKLVAHDYEIVETSSSRIKPKCGYFGICGGCLLQHLPYKEQIGFKEQKLFELLQIQVDVIPSPKIYGYRNRVDIAITTRGIGFRKRGTWWNVVDIEKCDVFGSKSKKALKSLRELIEDYKLAVWDLKKNTGFLRYIVLREGKFTEELMINLVTSEGELPERIFEYFDFATSLYWSVNDTKSDVSYGEPRNFWGEEFIREKLDDVTYFIHPNSFFQTNSYQAVNLVKKVSEFVEGERVLDLYSGVGTFGVYLAKRGFQVEGIEVNPFAVEMANKNVRINNVNAEFRVGVDKDVRNLGVYDTVIVDPPRAGLHPKLIKKLLRDLPETLVYVSCNPKTFSENLEKLKESYLIEQIVGLDMFPHTPHVEIIAKLNLKSKI